MTSLVLDCIKRAGERLALLGTSRRVVSRKVLLVAVTLVTITLALLRARADPYRASVISFEKTHAESVDSPQDHMMHPSNSSKWISMSVRAYELSGGEHSGGAKDGDLTNPSPEELEEQSAFAQTFTASEGIEGGSATCTGATIMHSDTAFHVQLDDACLDGECDPSCATMEWTHERNAQHSPHWSKLEVVKEAGTSGLYKLSVFSDNKCELQLHCISDIAAS